MNDTMHRLMSVAVVFRGIVDQQCVVSMPPFDPHRCDRVAAITR
jgi:hypothetical protein